jgi:SNF2 family DNA or RNA helicase
MKEAPRSELLRLLPKGFEFATKPRTHQLACTVLGMKIPRFLFSLEMGAGKSKIILDLIRLRKHEGNLCGALIAVPFLINLESWQNQLAEHAPDLTYTVLEGDKKERQALLEAEPTDVYLINYAGLPVYMAGAKRKTKKGASHRILVLDDAEEFSNRFDFVALDECHIGLSSVKALQYQLTKMLSWRAEQCYGTTGTPMGRDPEKFWPQMHVIDQGETLGHSLAMFHAAYFKEKPNHWAYSGFDYVFDNKKKLHLHQTLQHRSLRYTDLEFSDMPAVTYVHIPVHMTATQVRRNEEIVKLAQEAVLLGEPPTAPFIRQRQTAAGFIAVKGQDDTRIEVAFNPNPKIDALEQFIGELDEEEKLVIFHSFIHSGVLISALLDKLKIKHCGVGHGYKEPGLQLRRFITDPTVRVFVANTGAGGTGVDGLQKVCRYVLFYESPTGPTQRKQAEKRVHRDGQKKRVHIYDLVARGIHIDQRVLDNIAEGRDLFEAVVNGLEIVK